MSATILEVRSLAAGYGKKQIVHGIDLALGRGEILLVLGHNGAGKTTLMRAIFGLLKPTAGEVTYDGKPIAGRSPGDNVAEGIAFVPQGHGIFRTLSVRDNLELGGFIMADVQIEGKTRKVIMQAPKSGVFYILDRTRR